MLGLKFRENFERRRVEINQSGMGQTFIDENNLNPQFASGILMKDLESENNKLWR